MDLRARLAIHYPGGPSVEGSFALDLATFSVTVLFGASGCGKTTLLRCLAGLDRGAQGLIQAGPETWLDSARRVFLPPERRQVGYVFQETALFPHLSVASNVAYGLRRWSAAGRRARVAELLALAGLEGLEGRRPHELSGGQKQRAALARALAPRPRLLLLDEPFASLDRPAATQLRLGLRRMLQAMRVPAILVTHAREEALALGDQLLLMEEGRILRAGPPETLLGSPELWEEDTEGEDPSR